MGVCASNNREKYASWDEKDPRIFIHKLKLLQQEINGILKQREEESQVYEQELMVFAFREAEWKRERKKLREEVKKLQKNVEEKEEKIRVMEQEFGNGLMVKKCEKMESNDGCSSSSIGVSSNNNTICLMERMREERARRDEAIEKWKMLYLAIKHELDDLIKRTHEGTLYWKAEDENMMEELQKEVQAKDEIIEVLKAQIASMEDQDYKRKREIDILRQSLRIMSSNKGTNSSVHVKTPFTKSLSKLAFVN